FSMIPPSSVNINNISIVYANDNNSQVKLSNSSAINFSNSIEVKAYSGAIQLEADTRNSINSSSFNSNLEYSLKVVEVPNNTTLSFDASSGIYLQQATPQQSENLLFWSSIAESDDFKSGQIIPQEDTNYYFGLYNWLLASEDEKQDVASKYNLGDDLSEDDLSITLDWFETKQCDTTFKLNESNFSAVYSNLLEAYNPITSGSSINVNLPDGTYYIYNTNTKLSTQEDSYLDENANAYTEINYNFSNTNDLKENALILVVGSGVNTPVNIERVKNVSISGENSEIQEESANTLTATKLDITEKGSDELDLEEFVELNIIEFDIVDEEELIVYEEVEIDKIIVEVVNEVIEIEEEVIEIEEEVLEEEILEVEDIISNTPTEPPTPNGNIPNINSIDKLNGIPEDEVFILGGQLSITPVDYENENDNSKDEDDEDDEEDDDDDNSKDEDEDDDDKEPSKPTITNTNTDGKTIKTNSQGIKIAVEKDTSYTYVINDDTMDEADFKLVDFGDEDFEVYTSTTIMPNLDYTTVYDSDNQPVVTSMTSVVTRLINTQASSKLVVDLDEILEKDLDEIEEQLELLEAKPFEVEKVKNENTKVVTTHIYMRTGADQSYDTLKILAPGQQVNVLEVYDNGWNKVSYNNQIGYVYGQYLRPV
ncbi:MAG: SH3 domain-containing protein, partial [bacterium]